MLITAVGSGGDLADERLVDLEGIDRKLSKIAQTRVTRAEVIDRQLHLCRSQCFEDGFRGFGALHQNAFRQLQLKRSRIQARILEDCEYALEKVAVSELHRGDVYRHVTQGQACIQPQACLQASRRTQLPIGRIRRQSSATGINCPGGTGPRMG